MDAQVRAILVRILASTSDDELGALLDEARDPSNPVGLDYEHAQLSAAANQPDAKKVAATDALVRSVRSLKSSAPVTQPEDRKKTAAVNALRQIARGGN